MYDGCIDDLKNDNKMMARYIDQATILSDKICDVNIDEDKFEYALGLVIADNIKIDEKKPDFNKTYIPTINGIQENSVEPISQELFDLAYIQNRKRDSEKPAPKEYLSEQMNSFYSVRDNRLYVRELDGDTISESIVLPLKLHLQKVITVPGETENRVFLLGGAKEKDGSDAVSDCYQVDLEKKELKHVEKMGCAKLSMAAGLAPD